MVDKLNPSAVQNVISRVTDSEDLTDILIDVEDYFDTSNLYAFSNWIDGVIVSGPFVSKYWVKLTLKYKYKKMPDPAGGMRLVTHGTRIGYKIGHEEVPIKIRTPNDYIPGTKKAKMRLEKIWLIEILVPRRLVQNLSDEIMDLYDEDVDSETLDDADVQGISAEDAVDQGASDMSDLGGLE